MTYKGHTRSIDQATECSSQDGEGGAGLRHGNHQHGKVCAGTHMHGAGRPVLVAAQEDMVVGKGEDGGSGESKP